VDVAKGQLVLSREARETLDVQTGEVELRPVQGRILAYATLVAPWTQHAYATTRLAGRISRLSVSPGQFVTAGQPLAEVESVDLQTLRLELLNAQNDVRLSTKIVTELAPAIQKGAVPEQRLIEAETKYRQDLNALEIAKSKWHSLKLPEDELEKLLRDPEENPLHTLPILSPIQGVIIHADVAVGRVVDPTEHLFEIVDLTSVWVKVGVLERDLHQVQIGQKVGLTFAAYPGERFTAEVQLRGLFLDPRTHLGTVWAELSNAAGREARLLPGIHGQAQIGLPKSGKILTIPAAALMIDGAERFVLVEETATKEGSQYTKKSVATGQRMGSHIEVVSGDIVPGDRVVTQGSHELAGFFALGVLRPSAAAAKNIGLRFEPVRKQAVEEILQVDGAIDVPPDHRTFVSSPITGTLQRIVIDRNQTVRRGDVIAEVASLELHNMQLELLRAHLEAELFDESLTRFRSAASSLPQRRIWELENQRNASVNRRETLKQKLIVLGLAPVQIQSVLQERRLVEALPLRAPIDGVVVHFDRALGQVLRADEPLFEIHDLSQAWVQGYLSERDLARVRIGQTARVRLVADPKFVAQGQVVRSGRVVGTENRTLSMWVEFDQPPETVLHNMLSRLTLSVGASPPVPAIPLSAVIREGMRGYVFVRKEDGSFERRHVETGRSDDRHVVVLSGLRLGENIAVQGVPDLQTAYAGLK
jgi:RND family efflux transporter MFP subunit